MTNIQLQARKSKNKPHMTWDSKLLAQSSDWILTYSPHGTSVRHHTKDLTYIMSHNSFGIFNTKEFYNLFIDLRPDGSFKKLYINIATPAVLQSGEINWIDLELDIVRTSHQSAKIIDIDEFDEAKTSGMLDAKLADKAQQVAAELLRVVDKGDFPFLATDFDDVTGILAQHFNLEVNLLRAITQN